MVMSEYSLFMKANKKVSENKKYAPTASLCDKDGKPLEWEFKHLTSARVNDLRDQCTFRVPVKGGRKGAYTSELDASMFTSKLIVESTVFPDLYNAELQNSYGVKNPEDLLLAMVDNPGEYADLTDFVSDLHGFKNPFDDLQKEAKN